MYKIAVVFSGQGAQSAGMGKQLYQNFKSSEQIFSAAEKIRHGTIRQCFEGTRKELSQTINTQPCLFTVDVAAYAALKECGIKADGFAGFSLGELAGIVCSGMLPFESGLDLVCKRAQITDNASAQGKTGMAAVLKLDGDSVQALCNEIGGVYPVNYNCTGQTVVAGNIQSLDILTEKVKQKNAKAVRLAVSGAFHSPYMQKAYEEFTAIINQYNFEMPHTELYSNVTALPYTKQQAANLLALQIKSPVLWQKTVENMINQGYNIFIEAGWGNTLTNLIKRIDGKVKTYCATNKEEILQISKYLNDGS